MPPTDARPVHTPRVALAFSTFQPYLERVAHGVLDYATQSGGWHVALNPEGIPVTLESLTRWEGDGIIATIETDLQAALAQQLALPLVNLSARTQGLQFPSVLSDNHAIGASAAHHFLERGFRHCAFYGLQDVPYSEERLRGFQETILQAQGSVQKLLTPSSLDSPHPWDWDRHALDHWLQSLQGRVGLMAVHDYRAQLVLQSARRLGIPIPGQLAVLSVNDDPVACNGSIPPLTSIPQDGYRIGWEAAALLASQLPPKSAPLKKIPSPLRIPPLPISERKSTDMLGVEEPKLRAVLEAIESSFHRSIGVDQLAAQGGMSRRWLEHLFLKHLSCSPHAYLVQRRLRAARRILDTRPDIRLAELARTTGFPSSKSLRAALDAPPSGSPIPPHPSYSPYPPKSAS